MLLKQQLEMADATLTKDIVLRRKVHLVDQPDYEDRVRALLLDMEEMTK